MALAEVSLNDALFERALSWFVAEQGEASMLEARRTFERATGPITEGASDYEQRITHFLEQQLCAGEVPPIARFAAAQAAQLAKEERRELAGWLRSHRSLFAFEGREARGGRVRDCLRGGSYGIVLGAHDQELVAGDRFDGRLLPLGDRLQLSPGRVYHPPEAYAALEALVAQLDRDALPHGELLDGLLLMRSRYLQFESVRPEHVYQAEALAPVRLPIRA